MRMQAAVAVVVVAALLVASASAAITCGQVASSLAPCIPYATGNADSLPSSCCDGVRSLNSTARTCGDRQAACRCLKSLATGLKKLNMGTVSAITGKCGVSMPFPISMSTDCDKYRTSYCDRHNPISEPRKVHYRRMGNMVRHLANTTSSTSVHHVRDLWNSPRGTVLRLQTLAVAAIVITFFLVAFGSCRRWSSRWIVQKGFFAAQALSLSIGTYSIGLMQSSSVRSEMYPIWTVSLFTLFGCIDPVTTYNGFDYKGPLSKVVYAICLYCAYALLMSISGVSSVVGNTAICMLSVVTFIKGFHRTLAFVQQSRMRNTVARLGDGYDRQTSVLRYPYTEGVASIPGKEPGSRLIVELVNDNSTEHVRLGDVVELLSQMEKGKEKEGNPDVVESLPKNEQMDNSDVVQSSSQKENRENSDEAHIPQKEKKHNLWSCYNACVAYGLSHSLQRHFLGLSSRKVRPEPLKDVKYKWALEVVAIELAFLHDIFFTGNAFLHYYQARTSCLWALASFTGICFVGVSMTIPGGDASGRGGSTNVVDTTTADLVITFAILVSLALVQLMQLFQCWTSNWARVAVICRHVNNNKRRQGRRPSNSRRQLWTRLKSSVGIEDSKSTPKWWKRWMRLRSFLATCTKLFDNKYLWQEMIGQYSVLAEDGLSITITRSDYRDDNRGCCKMFGLDYIWEVLWDLLGSDTDKRGAVPLDEEVKTWVTDFLGQIKEGTLEAGSCWSSYPGHSDIEALFLPYAYAPELELEPVGSRYARCVLALCVATWHCELAEQEQERKRERGARMGTDPSNNMGKEAAAAAAERGGTYASINLGKAPPPQRGAGTHASNNQGKEAAAIGGTDTSNNLDKEAAAPRGGTDANNNLEKAAGDENQKHRRVANALSKYCAYLVVCVPELLPGLVKDTRRVCDLFACLAGLLPRDKDRLLEGVSDFGYYWMDLYNSNDEFRELWDLWKMLAAVWVRMLVYAAPYGNPEAHMRQLSHGGEFITHLWALLYHLSIREWNPPGSKKTTGGGLLSDTDGAQRIINNFYRGREAVVVAFLHSKYGYYADELDAASKLEKRVSFYQTTSPEVAKLFRINPAAKRPSLVLLNDDEEEGKFTSYDGDFKRYAIAEFVSVNKLPLVTKLTQKTVSSLDGHPIHKLIILFADKIESSKFLPVFKEAANLFRGKLLFVFVEQDNKEDKQAASDFVGSDSWDDKWSTCIGRETTVLAYTRKDNIRIPHDGEVSLDTIKKFAQDFDEDKLYLSEPPDVKTVLGSNIDQIVFDESKDVLLVIYEPDDDGLNSCMIACNKLAKHLGGINSLVIAKMDCTTNWHPHANKEITRGSLSVPKVLFYPAKRKHFEPITFEGEQSVKGLYKFIREHADIAFDPISTLEKDASTENVGLTKDEIQEIPKPA